MSPKQTRTSAVKHKAHASSRAAAGRAAVARMPTLRFHYPRELEQRTLAALEAVETAPDPCQHVQPFSTVAIELTEAGLSYFLVEPLKAARAGLVIEQAAALGVSSAGRVLSPVIRSVMGWLDKDQLLVVAAHVRRFMD